MRRTAALALLVLGQSFVATLDPTVALMPAFIAFLGAGTIMARASLAEPQSRSVDAARNP
jgi:hypothetical protein